MIREYSRVHSDVSLLASGQLLHSMSLHSKYESNTAGGNELGSVDTTNHIGNEDEKGKHRITWIDPSSCCFVLYSKLASDKVLLQPSPLALAKALKVTLKITII